MPQVPVTSIEIHGKTLRVLETLRVSLNKASSTMGMTLQTITIFRRDLADVMFSGILERNPKGLGDP